MGRHPPLLRIEREAGGPQRTTFRLQGRLGSLERETLLTSVAPCLVPGHRVEVDLGDLRFLDYPGAQLLCALRQRGARLTSVTGYVRAMLQAVEDER